MIKSTSQSFGACSELADMKDVSLIPHGTLIMNADEVVLSRHRNFADTTESALVNIFPENF